jgi:hypothetical protein
LDLLSIKGNKILGQAWWYMPVNPVMQEAHVGVSWSKTGPREKAPNPLQKITKAQKG